MGFLGKPPVIQPSSFFYVHAGIICSAQLRNSSRSGLDWLRAADDFDRAVGVDAVCHGVLLSVLGRVGVVDLKNVMLTNLA